MGTDAKDEISPIDVLLIGYPKGSPMTGEAAGILLDLVERKIVRVLDLLFILKHEDGGHSWFAARDLDADAVGDFVTFDGVSSGLLGEEDAASAAEAMEPGEAAALLMFENRWAAPFVAAVRRNGGQLLASQRIPAAELIDAIEQLDAA